MAPKRGKPLIIPQSFENITSGPALIKAKKGRELNSREKAENELAVGQYNAFIERRRLRAVVEEKRKEYNDALAKV